MMRKARIYVASKTKHAPKWRLYRDRHEYNIVSTWIDEAGNGETEDRAELAARMIHEIRFCDTLIAFAEQGDDLVGALIEIGVALAHDKPIYLVGNVPNSIFDSHPLVCRFGTMDAALRSA